MKFDVTVPLFGFDEIKEVELSKIDDIFMHMESTQERHLSFTLVNPFVLQEYDFELPSDVQMLLEIDEHSNILIFNIVLLQKPIEDSLVNFLAPLIFNTQSKKMAQIILDDDRKYSVAQKIGTFIKK